MIELYTWIYDTLITESYDSISSDFDFINNAYAVEVKIGENIVNRLNIDDITLQVRIVGLSKNKITLLEKAEQLDNTINNSYYENYHIVRENPYMATYIDEDKTNIVLQYLVKRFNFK